MKALEPRLFEACVKMIWAIATRLETIATRVEDIAIGLEATAIRLEAIVSAVDPLFGQKSVFGLSRLSNVRIFQNRKTLPPVCFCRINTSMISSGICPRSQSLHFLYTKHAYKPSSVQSLIISYFYI